MGKRLGELKMMMTSDWVFILDEAEALCEMILSSEPAMALQQAYDAVYSDTQIVEAIYAFNRMKEQYEDVQRFGKYHPDYHTIMKSIRQQKRALDLNEKVSALKIAENDFQSYCSEYDCSFGKPPD